MSFSCVASDMKDQEQWVIQTTQSFALQEVLSGLNFSDSLENQCV